LLKPEQYHSLQVNTSEELTGLQILNPKTEQLEVVAPIAFPSGESRIDRAISSCKSISTAKLTLDEAAARMRGPIGSHVPW